MNKSRVYQPRHGEVYRALSVRQPWASMIVYGMKTTEYRSTNFHHRGPILIHASANKAIGIWRDDLEKIGMADKAFKLLPRGCYIGVATLIDVDDLGLDEEGLRSYGLHLEHPRAFRKPVAAAGALGTFLPSSDVWKKVRSQIKALEF